VRRTLQNKAEKLDPSSWVRRHLPRYGWLDMDFMKSKQQALNLVEGLRGDLWDKNALKTKLTRIDESSATVSLHYLWRLLLHQYHIDSLLN